RNLDLDVLAGTHDLLRLLRMDLRWRRDDRGIDAGLRERLVEIRGPVRNTVLLRNRFGGLGAASREADDLDAVDVLQSVEMLSPECSLPDDDYFHWTFLRIAEWLEADPARTRARFRLPNEATFSLHGRGRPRSGSIVYHELYCNCARSPQPQPAADPPA